jgi:hypothetical protein
MRIKFTREEHNKDLNSMFNQLKMLIDMYSDCSNVEIIGILHLLIHQLSVASIKPIDDSDK